MSERVGSDIERLWIWIIFYRFWVDLKILSFYFPVVVCRIRLCPTLISKIKWLGSGVPRLWTTLKTSFWYYLEWYPLTTLSMSKFFVIFLTKIRIYKKVSRNWTPENDWNECQSGHLTFCIKSGKLPISLLHQDT